MKKPFTIERKVRDLPEGLELSVKTADDLQRTLRERDVDLPEMSAGDGYTLSSHKYTLHLQKLNNGEPGVRITFRYASPLWAVRASNVVKKVEDYLSQ